MSEATGDNAAGIAGGGDAPSAPRGELFRDPSTLLRWVAALLILGSLASLITLMLRGFEYFLLTQIEAGVFASRDAVMAAAAESDGRVVLSGNVRAILFFATCIPFGMWIYRASKNTRALGATGLRSSPGWAVGSYFVPIVNLFAPFIAMREIWQASADPGNWPAARRTPLLGWWWFLWLAAAVSGSVAQGILTKPGSMEAAKAGSLVASAQSLFYLALNIVAFLLIRRITANQLWQARIAQVF